MVAISKPCSLALLLAVSSLGSGCKDPPPPSGIQPVSSTVTLSTATLTPPAASSLSAGDTPAPSASSASALPPPACRVLSQKSWGKGVNKTTGLTVVELPDGRAAVGLSIGLTPHVLVVARGGEGRLVKVPIDPGPPFAKTPPAGEATRHLMRVTPVKVSGDSAEAYVDYRDEYKNKRKRVACGAARSPDAWILFDGTSLLDLDPRPKGDELAALFKPSKDKGADAGYHELRDCRTFSDLASGETWVVGSELRGKMNGEAIDWSASLVVDRGPGIHEDHLHEVALKGDPPKAVTKFEIPVSQRLHGGEFLLATRFGGSLSVVVLSADKTMRGEIKSYPGFPTLPDVATDGDDTILVTSFAKGKDEFLLRGLRLSAQKPDLPAQLNSIALAPDDKDSETDPDFTRDSKGRRWLSYVDGERGHGKLFIAPLDQNFKATGRPYEITQNGEKASEARLVATTGGTLLVAFLREGDGGSSELVTEDLECDVVL